MEPAELSTMLKPFFYAEASKVSGRKTIQSQHRESQFVPAGQIFFWFSSKKIIRDKIFKPANETLNPSLKDLARQGLISFTKHKPPISSEDLEVLYAANQLGLNPSESFANSAWFNTNLYFGKRGRENQRAMKPGDLQLNNNKKPAEVLHLKRESDENQSTFKCSRFYTFCVSRL